MATSPEKMQALKDQFKKRQEEDAQTDRAKQLAADSERQTAATMDQMEAEKVDKDVREAKSGLIDFYGGRSSGPGTGYLGETVAPEVRDAFTATDKRTAQNRYLHDQEEQVVDGDLAQAARQSGALTSDPMNDPEGSLIGPPPDAEVPGATKSAYAGRYSDPVLLQRQLLEGAGSDITAEDEAASRPAMVMDPDPTARGFTKGMDEVRGRMAQPEGSATWEDVRKYDDLENATYTPDYIDSGTDANMKYMAMRDFEPLPGDITKVGTPDEYDPSAKGDVGAAMGAVAGTQAGNRTAEGAAIDRAVGAATAPPSEGLQERGDHLNEWKRELQKIGLSMGAMMGNPAMAGLALFQLIAGENIPEAAAKAIPEIAQIGEQALEYFRTTSPQEATIEDFVEGARGVVERVYPGSPLDQVGQAVRGTASAIANSALPAETPAPAPAANYVNQAPSVQKEALVSRSAPVGEPDGSARAAPPEIDTVNTLGRLVATVESGGASGDGGYSALFKNAEQGPFQGVDVSQMTLGDLAAFSDPDTGPYAQWSLRPDVRPNAELPATPMGRYQIVGNTMRRLQAQMGLPDDTVFSPEVQEAMFLELLNEAVMSDDPVTSLKQTFRGLQGVPDSEIRTILGMQASPWSTY